MKIAHIALLLHLPMIAAAAAAQPAPPPPKPCVLMPREAQPPAAERPRDRCATLAFPRSAPSR